MRIAIAAAVVVLSAHAAAAQERGWLAIGTESASHGFSFGSAADAVNACGFLDCAVVETFTACLAVGYSSETTSGRPVWTWTEATTEADANRGAREECTESGGLACAVLNTYCLEGASTAAAAQQAAPPATAEQETVFWQSIVESTNPAMFEAYLAQFPSGVFRALAEARLAELRAPAGNRPDAGIGSPASGSRPAGGRDAPRRPGEVFRDCAECPEMVVLPGGGLALGQLRGDGGRVSCVRVGDGRWWGRLLIWRFVARPRLCADGSASGDVRELG